MIGTNKNLRNVSIKTAVERWRAGDESASFNILETLKNDEQVYGLLRSDFLYFLPLSKESTVLEVGCGVGSNLFTIAPYVKEIVGIDGNEENIDFCSIRKKNEKTKNVTLKKSTTEEFFSQNQPFQLFDVILIREDLGRLGADLIKKISSIIRPEGVFCILGCGSYIKTNVSRLKKYGFYTSSEVYMHYPNSIIPRFIIPWNDKVGLDFILKIIIEDKNIATRILAKIIIFLIPAFFLKLYFGELSIIAKK